MTYEHVVLDSDAFANERVTRNLTAGTDDSILLNLNKTTNARLIPDCTTVKISETEYLYGTPQGNIGSDAVKRFHAVHDVPASVFASCCCDMTSRASLYELGLLSQAETHVNKRPQD